MSEDKDHREIAFHISCRFQENVIIRNHKTNNAFGVEEKVPGKGRALNPLRAGDEFTLSILVATDRFLLSVNGKDFCEFPFRLPLARIKVLQVLQDVEYIRRADHFTVYPTPYPLALANNSYAFSNDIPSQVTKGQVMVLHATALGNAQGNFSIHFVNGQAPKTSVVFNVALPPKSLLTRSFINDQGHFVDLESHGPKSPIVSQKPFKIAIGFAEANFQVAINGLRVFEYKYKTGMRTYSGIKCSEHDGLLLNILGVDHYHTQDPTLRGLEQFSRA